MAEPSECLRGATGIAITWCTVGSFAFAMEKPPEVPAELQGLRISFVDGSDEAGITILTVANGRIDLMELVTADETEFEFYMDNDLWDGTTYHQESVEQDGTVHGVLAIPTAGQGLSFEITYKLNANDDYEITYQQEGDTNSATGTVHLSAMPDRDQDGHPDSIIYVKLAILAVLAGIYSCQKAHAHAVDQCMGAAEDLCEEGVASVTHTGICGLGGSCAIDCVGD